MTVKLFAFDAKLDFTWEECCGGRILDMMKRMKISGSKRRQMFTCVNKNVSQPLCLMKSGGNGFPQITTGLIDMSQSDRMMDVQSL